MQFSYGLQPCVPCKNEDHAPELLGAWGAYAAAVLTGFGMQADANKVEYISWDAGNALGRFWVTTSALTTEAAHAVFAVAANPMVCLMGECTEVQYLALQHLLHRNNIEGFDEIEWFGNDINGMLFPSDYAQLLQITDAIKKVMG